MPHEELRAKEFAGDKGSILQEPNFIGGKLYPLYGNRSKRQE